MIIQSHNSILVLRDDLLPGGTKSVLLPHLIGEAQEYVYASPVYGGFQIALSIYCKSIGKQATIFCAERREMHPNTLKCLEHGAKVVQVKHGYLSVVEKAARVYCDSGAIKLQFGAKTEQSLEILSNRVKQVIDKLNGEPDEIWCAVGSGLLIESILKGTTRAKINGVCVGADYKLEHERVKLYKYPKPFEKAIKLYCPFPSMPNYDLKAWDVCVSNAKSPCTLFWNVL